MAATWNPANLAAGVTLSGGNLTWASTFNSSWTLPATVGKATGKWYFEVTPSSLSNDNLVGITDQSLGNTAAFPGSDVHGWGYDAVDGKVYHGNAVVSSAPASPYVAGNVIGVAVDLANSKLYFSKNGTWLHGGDPVAGTGGMSITAATTFYPAVGNALQHANGSGNFNPASPPTGYLAWDAAATVVDLAAAATAVASATATLEVMHHLAAAATAIASASAGLRVQHHLAAAATAVASASADLRVSKHLAAAAAAIATASATANVHSELHINLMAAAAALVTASASLNIEHHLAGGAQGVAQAVAGLRLRVHKAQARIISQATRREFGVATPTRLGRPTPEYFMGNGRTFYR